MRRLLFVAAIAASAMAGAGAASLDIRAPWAAPPQTFRGADAPICEALKFNLYFRRDDARLSAPAERMLDLVGGHVRGCAIKSVAIETPANEMISPEERRIAGARSAAVLSALHARGVSAGSVIVTQAGAANEPASAAPPHVSVAIEPAGKPAGAGGEDRKTGADV